MVTSEAAELALIEWLDHRGLDDGRLSAAVPPESRDSDSEQVVTSEAIFKTLGDSWDPVYGELAWS